MKRIIALLLALMMCLALCACGSKQNTISRTGTIEEIETPIIDTDFPDSVCETNENYVTVEMALEDLCNHSTDECLEYGDIYYDKTTYEYPDYDSFFAIFWFDIVVPYEYGNENFRAKMIYLYRDGSGLSSYDYDLWQVDSDFSETGIWSYDDGETHIWINYLRKNENAYVVEYDITYYSSSWTKSHWVSAASNGEVNVFGNNEWDGDSHYLSIDLGTKTNTEGEEVDLGRIEIYPWYGVFWDALHANGPYRLEQ